ncbi:MAG: hemerythrin domain-containing protein [Devosia sp.]
MLLDISFLDDSTRPTVSKLDGLTPRQREAGEHLKQIHNHFRDNMQAIRQLIQRAGDGFATSQDVEDGVAKLEMVGNLRRFGNLCGQHCQIVNTHHSIEDAHVLPALASISDGYRRVTDRLAAEHVVVHELLERQIDTLNALATAPSRAKFDDALAVYEALERVLVSHLGYEEDQIGDALGYFDIF